VDLCLVLYDQNKKNKTKTVYLPLKSRVGREQTNIFLNVALGSIISIIPVDLWLVLGFVI
jgi:hypothetical protein